MLLKILTYPDSRLKQVSKSVVDINDDIKSLVDDMFDTMYADDNNCGLAAPQIGHLHRITVIDPSENKDQPLCLINPEILETKGTFKGIEACLSLPGAYEEIQRSEWIRFKAKDIEGKYYEMEADGLLAECVQHEIDHLDGILFIDRLSQLRKQRALARMKKHLNQQKME